ncbi:MAG TPA: sigma-70 family RNA polymerase sigma factor [Gemmatimonadales bacterium]|nr:sigma-70 family RNA polymerase sigma factor [Gemmatimonadales bacterium]
MPTEPDRLSPALENVLGNFSGVLRHVSSRFRFTGSDVDELVQEVRIRLWRAHARDGEGSEQIEAIPASYLHRTALSAAIDLLRRRRARRADQMVPLEDEPGDVPEPRGPEGDFEAAELTEQVERAIETIPASRRPVVRMHLMGHSRDEIASVLGWSDSKTRNLLYRGLADVRERLVAQGVRWSSPT